ncbi:MAG: sulfate ABC transporter substrate-binding protein [Planctomycetia bacterium]|nr:sulfate ABC transporter substrate-binding protein [Planctomycetia bacterium]
MILGCGDGTPKRELYNVSYDPTRELYEDFNQKFEEHWMKTHGEKITVIQSHGGSGDQAKKVIEGQNADVVTLALAYDINAISEQSDLIQPDWQQEFPNNSCPYTSTIVLLVRKGNPKNIKDWDDLLREDVGLITPNPKTSGGARWNYLAAWAFEMKRQLGGNFDALKDPAKKAEIAAADKAAEEFVKKLHKKAVDMPTGARGATNMFVRYGQGDVLLAWENEALLTTVGLNNSDYEIIIPSISIVAEPPVGMVDKNVDKNNTRELATAYLQYLYDNVGQEIAAKHFYRPSNPDILAKNKHLFKDLELVTVDDIFGGWKEAQKKHFAEGGIFDKMMDK